MLCGIYSFRDYVLLLGMEWCYRLYQEPKRLWRRYLVGNVVFLARVAQMRLAKL